MPISADQSAFAVVFYDLVDCAPCDLHLDLILGKDA